MGNHEKALLKLLNKHGYELAESNDFGYRIYRLPGCRDVDLHANPAKPTCERFTRQVQFDIRHHDPEDTPEQARKQSAWETEQAERVAREAADAALVKDKRLGGASAVLTESEVDAIAKRLERIHSDRRQFERLIRERPLGAGRRTR